MRRIIFVLMVFLLMTVNSQADNWQVTDLGTLGGRASYANDINNLGQIVGSSDVTTEQAAFLWDDGVMTQIAPLGSLASKINADGLVVGQYASMSKGFVWKEDVGLIDLGSFGGGETRPKSINNEGQIIGSSSSQFLSGIPFIWENGVMTQLPYPLVSLDDINDLGMGSGLSRTSTGAREVILWNQDTGIQDLDLEVLVPAVTNVGWFGINEMNNQGQMVGYAFNDKREALPALWDINGDLTVLGTLMDKNGYGYAKDLNEFGQIVGSSVVEGYGGYHGFLWENGGMTDLNSFITPDSGWVLEYAEGINDRGQIVGFGRHNGIQRAFLLEKTETAAVPEPATVLLFGIGGVGMLFRRLRRKTI